MHFVYSSDTLARRYMLPYSSLLLEMQPITLENHIPPSCLLMGWEEAGSQWKRKGKEIAAGNLEKDVN